MIRDYLRRKLVAFLDLNLRDIPGKVGGGQITGCAIDSRHICRNAVRESHIEPGTIIRSHEGRPTWMDAEPPRRMTHWMGKPIDENGLNAEEAAAKPPKPHTQAPRPFEEF